MTIGSSPWRARATPTVAEPAAAAPPPPPPARAPAAGALGELFRKGEPEGDLMSLIEDERDKLAARLVGWSGIKTDAGAELPFSSEARDRLLKQRPIRIAIMQAYSDAVIYGGQAEKN